MPRHQGATCTQFEVFTVKDDTNVAVLHPFKCSNFKRTSEKIEKDQWLHLQREGSHWPDSLRTGVGANSLPRGVVCYFPSRNKKHLVRVFVWQVGPIFKPLFLGRIFSCLILCALESLLKVMRVVFGDYFFTFFKKKLWHEVVPFWLLNSFNVVSFWTSYPPSPLFYSKLWWPASTNLDTSSTFFVSILGLTWPFKIVST